MTDSATCPTCHALLPAGRTVGMCPCCLLRTAISGEDSGVPREEPGTVIDGRYRLLEEIGEGGFAIVYLAEQTFPVTRRVALKILKPGMDTREVVARFEAERQTLALMDHPNIAQVFDGGSTGFLRPYFVMELVNGQPLTQYCDRVQFNVRQRLELMLDVLSAVQHAHQKGIIHRDLKPSNILVSVHDGKEVIKVIDFGIAKALGPALAGKTVYTSHGRLIGTPEYMSPEQAEGRAQDVDTRSDVYSLGAVLYELLTGHTPLDSTGLRTAGSPEMQRLIRQVEPPRPSTRIGTASPGQAELAKRRGTESWKLRNQVCGDLDWIVMKALEKDRGRRYPSTSGLAADLQRFLGDEPVTARPPGMGYRFGKFAKRNKVALAFISLIALILISATVFSLGEAARAKLAKDEARAQLRQASLSEARALRMSGQTGRRFGALKSLRTAAGIRPGPDLRDEAISILGVADLQNAETWSSAAGLKDLAAVAPDFSCHAVTQPDGTVLIAGNPGGGIMARLPGAGVPVNWLLRFSPDSGLLAIGHGPEGSPSVRTTFWDWKNNRKLGQIGAITRAALDFSPDGSMAAAASDRELAVVDPRSGGTLRSWSFLSGSPYCLRFRPDGKAVAVSSLETASVTVIGVDNGKVIAHASFSKPRGVDWHRDRRRLAVACEGEIIIWDTTGSTSSVVIRTAPKATIDRVAWSHATELLASSGWQQPVSIHDAGLGETLVFANGDVKDLCFSKDDTRLGLTWNQGELGLFEVADGHISRHASGNGDYLRGAAWHPSGGVLATLSDDSLRFWNREMRDIGGAEITGGHFLSFTPGGMVVVAETVRRHSYQLAGDPPELRLGPAEILAAPQGWQFAGTTRDGRLLAVAGRDRVLLFDLDHPAVPREIAPHRQVDQAVLSPQGDWMATATYYGTGVKVWAVNDGRLVTEFPGYDRCRVSFSHDGQWLVAGTGSAYHFHRTGTWQLACSIPCRLGSDLGWLAWSPRHTVLVLEPEDFTLAMYDAHDFSRQASPQFERQRPLGFSPDGSLLATTDPQHRIHVWNLALLRDSLGSLGADLVFPPLPASAAPLVEGVRFEGPSERPPEQDKPADH